MGMLTALERLVDIGTSLASDAPPARTLLTYAISCKRKGLISFLLGLATRDTEVGNKVHVNEQNGAGEAPVHVAARFEVLEDLVQELCEKWKADVNITDTHGATPLIIAIRAGCTKTQDILLSCGADPTKQDHLGRDALYWACLCLKDSKIEKFILLISKKNDARQKDSFLRALPAAIAANKIGTVLMLLAEENLDLEEPEVADRDGWTPRYITERYGHSEIAYLIGMRSSRLDGKVLSVSLTPFFFFRFATSISFSTRRKGTRIR